MNISISQAASQHIHKMLAQQQGIGLHLSIKKTGCSGYSYVPQVIAAPTTKSVLYEIENLKIFLDVTWLHLLENIQIDLVEEDKSGLKQKRLVFINPKEAGRCGCGESFNL